MDGILLVDKPAGITSYGVVDRLKKTFGLPQVGHGGSLDPMATGLLVILLGTATKTASRFLEGEKEYDGKILLGRVTDTHDITGRVLQEIESPVIERGEVERVLESFLGEIEQVPPMVSARRYKGVRLYRLARQGITVPRPSRKVRITKMEMKEFSPPYLRLIIRCSKGTYIRTISHDLGAKLGVGACLASLRRTVSGPFRVEGAYALSELLSGSKEELADKLISKASAFR